MKFFLNIVLLVACLAFRSSEWQTVDNETMSKKLEEISRTFNTFSTYSLRVTHASYEDFNTNIPHEKSVGYFKKDKNNYHSYLMGIHTIQNAVCRVVVDSANATIAVANPSTNFENTLTGEAYTALLKTYSAIKKKQENEHTVYRFEFPSNYPVTAYQMSIEADGFIDKVIIFYNHEVKRENGTVTKPRMEISLNNWNKTPVYNKADFDQSRYVIKKGEHYVLANAYSTNYKLLDQRVVTKNK